MSHRKIKPRGSMWSPSPDVRTYCDLLVYLWPEYRRAMEAAGTYPATVLDQVELNSIAVFREIRDAIQRVVESDRADDAWLKLPEEMGKRYILAGAFLRQRIDPAGSAKYRTALYPQLSRHWASDATRAETTVANFELAVFDGKWSGD